MGRAKKQQSVTAPDKRRQTPLVTAARYQGQPKKLQNTHYKYVQRTEVSHD